MYTLIVILPLISFFISIFFSRFISHRGVAHSSCYLLVVGLIFAVLSFYEVVLLDNPCYFFLRNWINISQFCVNWSFYFDSLTVTMVLVVYLISTVIHVYSVDYMWGDPHFPRFMGYLSFFTFFMIILVSSGNILQVFIGWEGVGLCSFLLISFWFSRTQAVLSALKAFIMNRIGDLFFILGICLVFFATKTLDYFPMFLSLKFQEGSCLPWMIGFKKHYFSDPVDIFSIFQISYIDAVCISFFIAAMSKSAQVFLHTWLPDAMEGPTPVSALIHAATMVAAGVFLVLRMSFIFDLSENVLQIIAVVGGVTCFFAGTVAFFQNDIKKIIAYSTCSQLGYMFFSIGLALYSLSFFHLCSHAFFKALLFLASGAVIHSLEGSQDLRKMGGLITKTPLTYSAFLIGSLALAGVPFFSGFYSKEPILEVAIESSKLSREFSIILGCAAAVVTAAYSYKLLHLTFFSEVVMSNKNYGKSHDPGNLIVFSLVFLSVFAIFFGFFFKDCFISYGSNFWTGLGVTGGNPNKLFDYEFHSFFFKILPIGLALFGLFISTLIWTSKIFFLKNLPKKVQFFFSRKWYFDNMYTDFFAKGFSWIGYSHIYKSLDKGFWELAGPLGLTRLTKVATKTLLSFQTGYIYHYVSYIVAIIFFGPIIYAMARMLPFEVASTIWLMPIALLVYYLYDNSNKEVRFYNNFGLYVIYLVYVCCIIWAIYGL